MKPSRFGVLALALALVPAPARADDAILVGLITKTETIPFFVKMREAASEETKRLGATLIARNGTFDGDNEGQVAAIEAMISAGVKGIMITPSDSTGVLGAVRVARSKGILVIALDTATDPAEAVDATIATDNFKAGEAQGAYAHAVLGGKAPIVLMLDGTSGSTIDTFRHEGYHKGMGLTDSDPAIAGRQFTNGATDKARIATENMLAAHPDVNAVSAISEAVAMGPYAAIEAAGKTDNIVLTAIDGGCLGVKYVKDAKIAATVMQFPRKMATEGVKYIIEFAQSGQKPSGFIDTGAMLITDKPVPGLNSKDTAFGEKACWG